MNTNRTPCPFCGKPVGRTKHGAISGHKRANGISCAAQWSADDARQNGYKAVQARRAAESIAALGSLDAEGWEPADDDGTFACGLPLRK